MTTAAERTTTHGAYTEHSKGSAVLNNKAENAHAILDKGDPLVNGPFLDDVRGLEEETYRKNRKNALGKKATSSSKDKKKSKEAPHAARQEVMDELDGKVVNIHKPLQPGEMERPDREVERSTKVHPTQRPLSNPSDVNPEPNLEVPTLKDVEHQIAMKVQSNKKAKKKTSSSKTAKKIAASRTSAKKTATKPVAKKTASKK